MTSRLLKILTILAVTCLVAGCKVAVIVTEGGSVQYSGSGSGGCAAGTVCTTENPFSGFSVTAVALPGYKFVKWNDGEGFLCGGSTIPTCNAVDPVPLEIFTTAQLEFFVAAVSAHFESYYVMPVFEDVGFDPDGDGVRNELDEDDDNDGVLDVDDICPFSSQSRCDITDTIAINDKEWAQPDLFAGFSWAELNAACPAGVCNGMLLSTDYTRSIDVTGWTWANASEVEDFFGSYSLNADPETDCSNYSEFFDNGMRHPFDASRASPEFIQLLFEVGFRIAAHYDSSSDQSEAIYIHTKASPLVCGRQVVGPGALISPVGGWFYRQI